MQTNKQRIHLLCILYRCCSPLYSLPVPVLYALPPVLNTMPVFLILQGNRAMPTKQYMIWAQHGHTVGMAWAQQEHGFVTLKRKEIQCRGFKSRGFKGTWQTLPLQNQLMPSGILACILLQPSRRDSLHALVNKNRTLKLYFLTYNL